MKLSVYIFGLIYRERRGGEIMDMKKLFEQFVKDNFDKAYRFAYTYTRDHHDAEDVLNESLLKAWKSIGSLRDEKNMRAF